MSHTKVICIALAAFLAGVVFSLLFLSPLLPEWLHDRFSKHKALAARQPLDPYTNLDDPEAEFEVVERFTSELPQQYVAASYRPELKGRLLRRQLTSGEVISFNDLYPQPSWSLEPGKMEHSIFLPRQDAGCELFIAPGCYVDVIRTSGDKTIVVQEMVRVHAIGYQDALEGPALLVTLELDNFKQVLKVSKANIGAGYFSLAVRAASDWPKSYTER